MQASDRELGGTESSARLEPFCRKGHQSKPQGRRFRGLKQSAGRVALFLPFAVDPREYLGIGFYDSKTNWSEG